MKTLQFFDGRVGTMTQVYHLLRQSEENPAGGSHGSVLRRAIEKRLADFCLQPANSLADSRLRSVKPLRRARKTLFLGYCDEHLKLVNIHQNTPHAKSRRSSLQIRWRLLRCLIGLNGLGYDITRRYVAIDIITLTIPARLPKI